MTSSSVPREVTLPTAGHAGQPSSVASPEGRRVLVALVTGGPGERIQSWRQQHDPAEARRIPPHTTLCYWAPVEDPDAIEEQVRHAFRPPVSVRLGGVREFQNDQHTFYVEVVDTAGLDSARTRLYDGTHLALPGRGDWPWHVTCVREARGRDIAALRGAGTALSLNCPWVVDTVAYLELRGDRYETLATWSVGP